MNVSEKISEDDENLQQKIIRDENTKEIMKANEDR